MVQQPEKRTASDIYAAVAAQQMMLPSGPTSDRTVITGRSAVERRGGIPWTDAYLASDSAIRAPVSMTMDILRPAEENGPDPVPNRADRRRNRRRR